MKDLDLTFEDSLGNVQTIDGEVVLSTATGAVSFNTVNKIVKLSEILHTEGSYVRKDLPNGRYRLTYRVTKKDENSSDTAYIYTQGKPDVLFISTNVELDVEYTLEFEVKERFLVISVLDSYDKNGTTEFRVSRLEELEVYPEDLPTIFEPDFNEINISGELAYSRLIKYFEVQLTGWFYATITSPEIEAISQTNIAGAEKYSKSQKDLEYEIRKDTGNLNRYFTRDVRMQGTGGGMYPVLLQEGKYVLVVQNGYFNREVQNINLNLRLNRVIDVVEINGKYYEQFTETSYIKLKF